MRPFFFGEVYELQLGLERLFQVHRYRQRNLSGLVRFRPGLDHRRSLGGVDCGADHRQCAGRVRTLPNKLLSGIATAYVELFRNVPLLVQLFIWYFMVPDYLPESTQVWFKQELNPATSAYISVVVCLALFTAARVCEQVRTGIQALPKGQSAAALAVGFTLPQMYRHVLLPQAFRIIIPPLTSEFLNIFKTSSVASLIGLMELLAQTKQTAEFTANMFEAFTLATLIYFVLNMSLMTFMSWVEKKVRIPGMMGGAK